MSCMSPLFQISACFGPYNHFSAPQTSSGFNSPLAWVPGKRLAPESDHPKSLFWICPPCDLLGVAFAKHLGHLLHNI